MRRWSILFTITFLLSGCAPPHPTHPTKVECPFEVETRFGARFDSTPLGPGTKPGDTPREDPCNGGGFVTYQEWTQHGVITDPICLAAGATSEQAASMCSSRFAATGRTIGTAAPPLLEQSPFGQRICPGSVVVVSSQIVGTGRPPSLEPQGCREGTRWPLLP